MKQKESRVHLRGFASMTAARRRELASMGGTAAHEQGVAHQFDAQEAREAGSKGGQAVHQKGTAHKFDSEEAREAGRKGGLNRWTKARAAQESA